MNRGVCRVNLDLYNIPPVPVIHQYSDIEFIVFLLLGVLAYLLYKLFNKGE